MLMRDMLFRGACAIDRICYGTNLGNFLKLSNKNSEDNSSSSSSDEEIWSFLEEPSDNGAFSDLTKSVKDAGSAFNELVGTFAASAIFAAIIFCGMELAIFKSGGKKQELKEHIPYLLLAVVFTVGPAIIFIIGKSIVNGLQSSL